jgi:hypothetical protein
MGMAVDNGSLMQNAWRRSEELHVLNEIGRSVQRWNPTLSSKKSMRKCRLFEMADFFIAINDETHGRIRFG